LSTVALNVPFFPFRLFAQRSGLCSPTVTCMLQLCLVGCD
jgi:hypothetical protein